MLTRKRKFDIINKSSREMNDLRKCRNWQTSKTKDLVSIALVWVQVPSSAFFIHENRMLQRVRSIDPDDRYAGVAELADAQASGACGSNIVWVQVPSPAFGLVSRDTYKAFLLYRDAHFI